jgi:hypothetical protein
MEIIKPDYNFVYSIAQRDRFKSGALVEDWRARYPNLFDSDDERLATSQPEGHFFEWLTAVMLFEATGYQSLVEYYVTKAHPQKVEIFADIVDPNIFKCVDERQSGLPDLFVYSKATKDWFFCEVKGNRDILRENQIERFKLLYEETGKVVRVASIQPLKP